MEFKSMTFKCNSPEACWREYHNFKESSDYVQCRGNAGTYFVEDSHYWIDGGYNPTLVVIYHTEFRSNEEEM